MTLITTDLPVSASPPAKPLSPPDAQRAALRDLVSLSTECAATEKRIDRELAATLAESAETLEKSQKSIRIRFESLRGQAAQKKDELLAEITQKHAADLLAIRQSEEPARRRAEAELEQVEQLVQKKTAEASWLADSDLEVTLNTLAAEEKKIAGEVGAQLAQLDALEQDIIRQAVTFGHQPGEADVSVGRPPAAKHPSTLDANDSQSTGTTDSLSADLSASGTKTPLLEEAAAAFVVTREQLDIAAAKVRSLGLPRLFVGVTPALIVFVAVILAAGGTWAATNLEQPNFVAIGIGGGAALLVCLIIGAILKRAAKQQVVHAFGEFEQSLAKARAASSAQLEAADVARHRARQRATHKRDTEIRMAREKYAPGYANAKKRIDAALATIAEQATAGRAAVNAARDAALADATARIDKTARDIEQRLDLDLQGAKLHHDRIIGQARERYDRSRLELESRLRDGLQTIQAPIEANASTGHTAPHDWESPEWANWKPPTTFAPGVRFGRLHVDLTRIARAAADGAEVRLALPPPFSLPATLAFPNRASLLIQADRDGRADAIRAIQMVMSRLLVSLPPGRVRFTLLDPVGLGQNFAGFMHLADHDDQLVGGRIWTEAEQIDQRLTNLTGHMETVIQKYLRNEFETIDDYNAQAGELAEPYRFLVISDFPASFSDEALRRLSSIASSGARCGIYTLIFQDTRQTTNLGTTLDDVIASSVTLSRVEGSFVWRDPVFEQFPLTLEPPPSEGALTRILDKVGKGAKEAARVEVPFETIAPPPGKFWSLDSGGDVHVPVGRMGATRLQLMRLGKGVAQHVLIAGKTGSGKSTLLHALVTNLALWYSPNEVEFYLIDFKKGVEFKTYATYNLPHARAIAVESDREFGLSVLQKLDAELSRRGELFRAAGVQDLGSYRKSPNPQIMPRTLLIVDEFQEFFSEDDKLAQDSSVLLDRLVRQGRAFGIHCLLGSQTIAGASGLPRSTIGQMAVRIALQTSEADSQLILGDNNSAARLLSRPGEAIYNDQGGLVEGNSPFQVAWLSDERKDRYLQQVREAADQQAIKTADAIVFEGNAPADLSKNRRLMELMTSRQPQQGPPRAWLGEPVAIKDPTAVTLRRQSGANVLVIGQSEEPALATLLASMISLAAQLPAGDSVAAPTFYIFDATPTDSTLFGSFAKVKQSLPHKSKLVEWRATPEAINDIATEVIRRRDEQDQTAGPIFLFIYGLQRYRVLRKGEDDFGFSIGSSDEPKPADPGKQFADILKEGPPVGVHTIAWADTATAVDRTLDRNAMREFDSRVLFQMGANDSSNLIDSPAANKLGFHRALVYSEEQGVMEKFRPYGLPAEQFLATVRGKMK
ncbi:FtsK/SpoIIIE domain-containing protein [Humisphaera borealis]|uniref:AAA family ATPase n=1 Tax=Humisphaera borealis TaxID=2807512 RepID=A0A7M2X1K0_9BACT|nr:FtsK/SpoIIIE domain-containing protein [Humisphaera borealis]QOV91626.1 AAA family ATPase [Humisphaera borealis]